MDTEREDVLEVWREREKAMREHTRHSERKAVISSLILMLGLAVGCALAYLAARAVR